MLQVSIASSYLVQNTFGILSIDVISCTNAPTSHMLKHLQVAEARERRRLQQEHEDRENALLRHELAEEQRREQAQKVSSHNMRRVTLHVGVLCNARSHQAAPA